MIPKTVLNLCTGEGPHWLCICKREYFTIICLALLMLAGVWQGIVVQTYFG